MGLAVISGHVTMQTTTIRNIPYYPQHPLTWSSRIPLGPTSTAFQLGVVLYSTWGDTKLRITNPGQSGGNTAGRGHSSCAFVAIVLCFCVLDQEICSAEWQKQEFESSVQVPVGRFWPDVSLLFLLTVVVLRRGKLPLGLRREEKRVS